MTIESSHEANEVEMRTALGILIIIGIIVLFTSWGVYNARCTSSPPPPEEDPDDSDNPDKSDASEPDK